MSERVIVDYLGPLDLEAVAATVGGTPVCAGQGGPVIGRLIDAEVVDGAYVMATLEVDLPAPRSAIERGAYSLEAHPDGSATIHTDVGSSTVPPRPAR